MSTLASIVLGLVLGTTAPTEAALVPVDQWTPQAGDTFTADTANNMGYLFHEDGSYTEFPIVTGQLRTVYYIGRTYYAKTPDWTWEVKSEHIKGDRVTFGPTGRFLRLYKNGEDRTAYGIHGHRDAIAMLEGNDRYRSMGCIIVSESVLDIIQNTYLLNDESLQVRTMSGNPLQETPVIAQT